MFTKKHAFARMHSRPESWLINIAFYRPDPKSGPRLREMFKQVEAEGHKILGITFLAHAVSCHLLIKFSASVNEFHD